MPKRVVAVPEQVVRLWVNGLAVATWSCTPAALEALAAGRLVALGFVASAHDILSLRTLPAADGILGIDAGVPAARAAAALEERDHRRDHACGLRFFLDCRPDTIAHDPVPEAPPPADVFPALFRELYERAGTYRATGGLHAAALSDGTRLLHPHEEVGRHNAADKAIGAALLDGFDLGALGLVTSARVSAEMAAKAARAGLAWVASRSVPTTLAVEIATVAGVPIVARAAGQEARVFAVPRP